MPSLRQELDDLAMADRCIARAEAAVLRQQTLARVLHSDGHVDAALQAQRLLQIMQGTLQQYRAHRTLIAGIVDGDIRARPLRDSD